MKTFKGFTGIFAIAIVLLTTSCNKQADTAATANATTGVVSSETSIAVAKSANSSTDSIYVVNVCNHGDLRETIAFSSLPAPALTYLAANYAGYAEHNALKIKGTLGNVKSYIAIVLFNNKPVGILFDASGNFVRVLEQREGHDLNSGNGWHNGGYFDDRDHHHRDTIALSVLPAGITAYFAANYPQDTLTRAFKNRDSSIVVLSIDNGVFATTFDANGNFIQKVQLPCGPGRHSAIPETALPSNVQSYLAATYPNYVFKHAFVVRSGQTTLGYVVFIDANNSKYAVQFDASGNFVRAVTVR